MSIDFEELDYQPTELGDLILRRRRLLSLGGTEVYEIKLGDAFLMSSLFTKVEVALADFGLSELEGDQFDVAVGGLGLGYTARAALADQRVRSVAVIEKLAPVIDWHRRGLVPLGPELTSDRRCRFVHGDFFELAQSSALDPGNPTMRFHAILLDIDHSPQDLLHSRHGSFYGVEGLRGVTRHLRAGGIFAMWSDDPPDDDFLAHVATTFATVRAHVVTFDNPLLEDTSASTVYVAINAA